MFEAAGAVYNESTGYYELYAKEGGLTDLTESDMLETFISSMALYNTNDWSAALRSNTKVRANMLYVTRKAIGGIGYGDSFNLGGFANGANNIEIVRVIDNCYPSEFGYAFANCFKLRKIIGTINVGITRNINAFSKCYKLADVRIGGLNGCISFPNSPLLSKDSILFMVQNCSSTKTITITLHPEAFAKAISDADIQAALAERDYVSLVQAPI